MSSDNPLHHLGRDIRILSAFIDALIAGLYAGALYSWKLEGALRTAIQQEDTPRAAATTKRDRRAMAVWGATDEDADKRFMQILRAAGLSDKQTEVAFWHFDRGLMPAEMGHHFGGDPIRLGAHLQEAREKLIELGRRTSL